MRRKIIIQPPPPEPKGIQETIRTMEGAAKLLRTLKANGVSREQRSKMLLTDIVERKPTPRFVNEAEYAIIKEIVSAIGGSEYQAASILDVILTVLTKALAFDERIKLNRLGTFHLEMRSRTPSVAFIPSPVLVQELKK